MYVWLGQLFLCLCLTEELRGGSLIEHPSPAKEIRMSHTEQSKKLQPIKWISLRLLGELLFERVANTRHGCLRLFFLTCTPSLSNTSTPSFSLSLYNYHYNAPEAVWIITFTVSSPSLPTDQSRAQRTRYLFEPKHTNIRERARDMNIYYTWAELSLWIYFFLRIWL